MTTHALFALIMLLMSLVPSATMSEVLTPGLTNAYDFAGTKRACWNEANELELSRCKDLLYQKSAKHLKQIENDIKASLVAMDSVQAKEFEKLSNAWNEFVRSSCRFDSSGAAGNSSSAIYASCMHDYSLTRIRQLEQYSYCVSTGACGQPVRLHLIVSPVIYGN
ncbi:hypothetical protein MTYM_01110 [Methylococcales bacterium]|nr:hypothetical protein MTYM_01110 [Methylococcales bacterium]